jgi:hypothetical protein
MKMIMRPILPATGGLINDRQLAKDLKRVFDKNTKRIKRDFEKTTRTWTKLPDFDITTLGDLDAVIGTDNQLYAWINFGTNPYIIRPRNGKLLFFKIKFRAKTRRLTIRSYKGGSGGQLVAAKQVKHPGIKRRDFALAIYDHNRPLFEKELAGVIRLAAVRAGQ